MIPTDSHVLAWLAGALEPGDARVVADRVAQEPDLQLRAEALRRMLEAPPRPTVWRIPPPGIPGGRIPVPLSAHHASVMGATSPRVGDRFRLKIDGSADPESVVVILRQQEDWEVVLPKSPVEVFRVGQLAPAEDGWWVDLLAPAPAGRQRWAIALVPESMVPADWEAPSWGALREALEVGAVSVTAVDVEILPR